MSEIDCTKNCGQEEPQTFEQALEILNNTIKTIEYRLSLHKMVRMVDEDYQLDIMLNNLKKAYDIVYYNAYAQQSNTKITPTASSNLGEEPNL